jgi:hypothetical protein
VREKRIVETYNELLKLVHLNRNFIELVMAEIELGEVYSLITNEFEGKEKGKKGKKKKKEKKKKDKVLVSSPISGGKRVKTL